MENNNIPNVVPVGKKEKKLKLIYQKKVWIPLAVVLLIIVLVVFKISSQGSKVIYTTDEVKQGDLIQTVSATGAVESAHDIDLNFKTTGRLNYLAVNEGSVVKSGQVLARLSSAGLYAQVEQYRANLVAAQSDLEKIKAGASREDITVSEDKVAKAENDLANLKIEKNTQLQIYQEKALNALNNASYTAQVSLGVVYNHLINKSTTVYLQLGDRALKNRVETNYSSVKTMVDDALVLVAEANNLKTDAKIIEASDKLRLALLDLNNFLDDAYTLADSIITNNNYSQADKDSIKADVDAEQSTNNASLTSLQTAKSNLINNINSYQASIQAAEDNLKIYRSELKLKQAGPRNFEINAAEAKVAQAQAQLNKALADLSDYTIVAPISGTVTKVNFDVGEQTNLSTPVIKMLSTENYEIKVDIPESDIAKVKIGDKTIVELDAFGSDHSFSGRVAFIDPAQTVISDVTYYKTTVSFDQDSRNKQIKPGMTADVTITTAEKKDVLYIPQRAVKIRSAVLGEVAEKYVEVLEGENKVSEKTVVVGLRGDGGLVEIVSGLTEGEKVITFKKEGK